MPRRRRLRQATVPQSARRHILSGHADLRSPDDFPVVGIGASAGGLDAFQKLLDTLPSDSGMAFILIQHLDPTHKSLMVELLARHTAMRVRHAGEGMRLEPNCVYVIPPGVYLSVRDGALRLSEPQARHGARLPFDFLLRSLAEELGDRAVCVILSGTGADGSLGAKSVKEKCGLVVAQDPDEAGYDGMPRSAIVAGVVDLVLPVAKIPEALVKYHRRMALARTGDGSGPQDAAQDWLSEIIDLLRTKTSHDFTLYKPGTLQRRIKRRMAMAAIDSDDMNRYLDALRSDPRQLELLVKDLLINVTSFFRDPEVFDFLAEKIVPELVDTHSPDNPLRIWVVGCSSGEEAYSLAMLLHEQIASAKHNVRLQIFASDVDPDAVAIAREGLYPKAIEADVSPDRLARFFTKEDQGYRISPELRSAVVFTVQDVLADPPFSRLDLISCRNLLIYLQPEAQAKVISLFHFALRGGGILLLGNSETVGDADDCFEVVSKPERLYRHIGRSRPGALGNSMSAGGGVSLPPLRPRQGTEPPRQAALAELCQRLVREAHAPAAVLVNRKYECLYSMGPTDRYLRVAPGHPTDDVLAMARKDVRTKLRAAIQRATQQNTRVVVSGGRTRGNGGQLSFNIDIQPLTSDGEELLLICFVEEPKHEHRRGRSSTPQHVSQVADLERELEATRTELEDAIRDLEHSVAEQKAIAEETLSVNEEFQAANEELLTSKEELQSLNEELTALNSQLQETLERQRTTSDDLQNVLYSTNVATLFLDMSLQIRFFTPAIRSIFHVLPSDVGRPLADLRSLAGDEVLLVDVQTVLKTVAPMEREIEGQSGSWYIRRVLPYLTQDNIVGGVVITYVDVTERKQTLNALEEAKRQAEQASLSKSRFLAAASHDLRQPLQALVLLQGILANAVQGEKAQQLVARLGDALASMSSILTALLDLDRIESGRVGAERVDFPINNLLNKLRNEFIHFAETKGLTLRMVPCSHSIRSDPQLLEQIMRNLLSNALKYTRHGKVLLGCRRREGMLSIEVWDTGIGIAEENLQTIFEEYYQVDNAARERSRGVGLGLSIVQRLASLLGHRIRVHSHPGRGSVFAIEVMLAPSEATPKRGRNRHGENDEPNKAHHGTGVVLVVEDDPGIRDLFECVLTDEGHHVVAAPDGTGALELIERMAVQPDLILTDYNLPNGMNGQQLTIKAREKFDRQVPVIIVTGDISADTASNLAQQNCMLLNKPVKLKELRAAVQSFLVLPTSAVSLRARPSADVAGFSTQPVVYIVDDDNQVLEGFRGILEEGGWTVEAYSTGEAFLEAYRPDGEACALIDAYLPGLSGFEVLQRLRSAGKGPAAILITGHGDVRMAVQAMKAGAFDFIEKPVSREELFASVRLALDRSSDTNRLHAVREDAAKRLARLTPRQHQIMTLILDGHPNKNIAADLNISQRTVENHRAAIMKKAGVKSVPALARLALAIAENDPHEPSSHGQAVDSR